MNAEHVVAILEDLRIAAPAVLERLLAVSIPVGPAEEAGLDARGDRLVLDERGNLTVLSLLNAALKPSGRLAQAHHDGEKVDRFAVVDVANVTFSPAPRPAVMPIEKFSEVLDRANRDYEEWLGQQKDDGKDTP